MTTMSLPGGGQRVVVALSGGVDSAVAAALLLRQGATVLGATLRMCKAGPDGAGGACADPASEQRASAVAEALGIEHRVLDVQSSFMREVLEPTWREYARGHTPNPCLLCNRRVKVRALSRFATSVGARYLATGHYARVERGPDGPRLLRGLDHRKDQSYVLAALRPWQLEGLLTPLGGMTKPEVRTLARGLTLPNAEARESQDACLPHGREGFAEAVRRHVGGQPRAGALTTADGRTVGHHGGVHRYTIGQRRGLGVALGAPAWVTSIDARSGAVTVSTQQQDLLCESLEVDGFQWLSQGPDPHPPTQAQIRYRHPAAACTLTLEGRGRLRVTFAQPQRAVTPGQWAVLYRGDRALGAGRIVSAGAAGS